MREKSFTLVEIMITIVIIGVVATIAMPIYRNVIEDAQAKVCQTNLKVLDAALNIYVMENDAMPGDLSELPPQVVRKAYAQVMQHDDVWKVRLAYSIVGWYKSGIAYAGLLHDLARGDMRTLTCPSDSTAPSHGGVSYGMNAALINMRNQDFRALSNDLDVIGDCETSTFADPAALTSRHKHIGLFGVETDNYSQSVSKGKQIKTRGRSPGQGQGQGVQGLDGDTNSNRGPEYTPGGGEEHQKPNSYSGGDTTGRGPDPYDPHNGKTH
ncbi:MAG: prepilin-type N-terminal cleavage/methylation domain-containing protein [Candidatus Omnitrophica bacterium]|nr:prepilin-type N-terminal cleavage/methylation domain-containing protein [Candidatus Omnitrophota bacterium]MDD5653773.1 prepilin-type N-terminal cleavage/methylation domain-containing protein [Candidatus Omnitrophota bacterium]